MYTGDFYFKFSFTSLQRPLMLIGHFRLFFNWAFTEASQGTSKMKDNVAILFFTAILLHGKQNQAVKIHDRDNYPNNKFSWALTTRRN